MNLKPLVNNTELYLSFQEYLDTLINQGHKNMENLQELEQLYRAQGSIQMLRYLKTLKERVNEEGRS